ncbi:hypothetical protein [Millisia brevis]|uniref:hypothetical protein n=1 Tax=Millisia brevis TaxID=264148 RepID=UPI000AEBBF40|nr:hypothetical protein [Millisia brevis]
MIEPVPDDASAGESGIRLWWLPVGAGGHVVVHTSRWWELITARREHRDPQPLFHAALEVIVDGVPRLIEMAPAWGPGAGAPTVVATGPVGLAILGRSRLFRYEIRCAPNGVLPDRAYAVDSPVPIAAAAESGRALLDRIDAVPRHTWGRDVYRIGDMWNSNSVVSWLLTCTDIDADRIAPPAGGRAPGWRTGIVAAR